VEELITLYGSGKSVKLSIELVGPHPRSYLHDDSKRTGNITNDMLG
jgi:hypothetical protein